MYPAYKTLESLLKHTAGTRKPAVAAQTLTARLNERHPDFTAVAAFKAGEWDSALILPVGPSCAIKTLQEAAGATVTNNRTLVGYWIR
jgi:hypothetical protein